MPQTKITKARIRNHFTYSWWKYLLLVCVAVFGWNLIYTSTAYRAPRDKRLDVYFVTYAVPEETLAWFRLEILSLFPGDEIEDAEARSVAYTDESDYLGNMQLSTYIGAREGDIYLFHKDLFRSYAQQGAFASLDEYVASGALDVKDLDVSAGVAQDDEGQEALYGIPAEALYGLLPYGIDNTDLVVTVMNYSSNVDKAVRWIDWLIDTMEAPMPEAVAAAREESGQAQEEADIPSY